MASTGENMAEFLKNFQNFWKTRPIYPGHNKHEKVAFSALLGSLWNRIICYGKWDWLWWNFPFSERTLPSKFNSTMTIFPNILPPRFGERYQTLMDMNDRVLQYALVIMFGGILPLSPAIAFVMEIFIRRVDFKRLSKFKFTFD